MGEFFKVIIKKISIDYPLYENVFDKLCKIDEENVFDNLNLVNKNINDKSISKKQVILELFKMLKFNSTNANLEKLKCSVKFNDRVGRNSGINIKNGIFIYKSVTGLRERKYEF
ncbi:MAG: hypothetical protein HFI86_05960 [Bacilli bacterium]|nr:hypothetical protein [Bacilli bacterium]